MSSIQERIAALNLGQVGRQPGSSTPQPPRQSLPTPQQPPPLARSSSADEQALHAGSRDGQTIGNQPNGNPSRPVPPPRPDSTRRLPPTQPASQSGMRAKPALPSRNSQYSVGRRDSQDSVNSIVSNRSSMSLGSSRTSTSLEQRPLEPSNRMKAPTFDASSLPTLSPSRREQPPTPNRPGLHSRKSSSGVTSLSRSALGQTTPPPRVMAPLTESNTARPGLPPRPPPRNKVQEPTVVEDAAPRPEVRPVSTPVSTPVRRSALSFGMNKSTEQTPVIPSRPGSERASQTANGDGPPPIPLGSRPDLAALLASKPKIGASGSYNVPQPQAGASGTSCLRCRDFSAPDAHAARFPRQGLPTQDLAWLAQQLTKPFDSATDKARAVFTWLHHNVAYDVEAFFSGNLKPSTPALTASSGLAVCEGYAALFVALAAHAGLEAVVASGHGKGYGYSPGTPVPTEGPTGHAWAAVKIDNGEWKLCDPCWGAGHIEPDQNYKKAFNPLQFTMPNEEFGEKHFPSNPRFLFVANPPTFAEYWLGTNDPGENIQLMCYASGENGIGEKTVVPRKKQIDMRALAPKTKVLFRMGTVCDHWDHRAQGTWPLSVLVLQVGGVDGRNKELLPLKHDAEHKNWWLEVAAEELGCPGQTVQVCKITLIDGKDARGVTVQEFLQANGRKSMSWSWVVQWQLV